MTTQAHRHLAKRINQAPAPLKNQGNDVFYEILDLLFTEEEAEVAASLPRMPATAAKVASKLHRPLKEIEPLLQSMADSAVIFSYGEGAGKKYFIFPIFPGVYEMQLWKLPDSERTLRLAKLYDELYNQEFAENLMKKPSRVFRIMPSEGSLPTLKTGVLPSDSMREVIERHDTWSLANWCACCCVPLANLTKFNTPAMFSDSRFLPVSDEVKCTACGTCARHCISGALHVYGKKLIFEKWRCIGCGVCVPKCKQGALKLVARSDVLPVPENYGQMFVDVGNEWVGMSRPGDKLSLMINHAVGNVMQRMMKRFA